MSLQSSRRRTIRPPFRAPIGKIKKAAAHVVEALESRRLLDATQQFIYTWEHLSPVARHDLAVLETVYPEATAQLDTYVESLGLAPIAPEAGTLWDDPTAAAKGRLGNRHHKPPHHPKPHPKHHGKDNPPPSVSSVSFYDQNTPNQITITVDQDVTSTTWSSAVTFLDLSDPTQDSLTKFTATYEQTLSTPTSAVYNLYNNDSNTNNQHDKLLDGNYAAIIDGSQIQGSNGDLIGSDGVSGHDYLHGFSFHAGDVNDDGVINSADLQIVLANLNSSGESRRQGDTNYDTFVNSSDLQAVLFELNQNLNPLQTPTTPYVTASGANSISIAWTDSDVDATSFDIYRDSTWIANVPGTTSYTDSAATAGTHNYFVVAKSTSASNTSYPSGELIAVTAPQANQPTLITNELPQQLRFQFNQHLTAVNWNNAISVINLNTQQSVVVASSNFTNAGSGTYFLTYTFSSTLLADANYAAILHGAQIVSDQGVELAGSDGIAGHDYLANFSFLNGDMNNDGIVNSNDVSIVQNDVTTQKTPVSYTNGDINFDGVLTQDDVTADSNLLGHTLPILTTPSTPTASADPASVTLTWTALPNTTYDIYRNYQFAGSAPGGTYIDSNSNLYANTTYTYFIVARDAAGDSSYISNEVIAKTTLPPPATPSIVYPSQLTTPTSILISWTDSTTTPLTYDLFRDGAEIAANTTSTSYLDTGLTPGSPHTYTVQALNANGAASSVSTPQTFTTQSAPSGYYGTGPQPPSGVTATPPSSNSPGVTITWSPSPSVATEIISYEVDRNGVAIGGTTLTTFTDTTALTGVAYTYTVTAYDPSYNASTPASGSLTISDTTAPNVPLDLQVTKNDGSTVTLSWVQPWDDVGVTGYYVYRDSQQIAFSPGTTYSDDEISPGETYAYKVVAVDAAGNNAGLLFPPSDAPSVEAIIPDTTSSPSIDVSPQQFIPQAWQDDFYNNLTAILRQRMAAVPGGAGTPPEAQFWYDANDTIISGTLPTSGDTTQIEGASGLYCYYDSHGKGVWTMDRPTVNGQKVNLDDPVWEDVDHTGIYRDGEPIIDSGNGTLKAGDAGKTNGICYANISTGTLIWEDSTTSFSQDFANFYVGLNNLLPYYANGGGDIDNPSSTRLSAGFVLQNMYGGVVNEINITSVTSDTLTITEPNPGQYQFTDTASALTRELKPGDNILITDAAGHGTWYPIGSYGNSVLSLSEPYVGATGSGMQIIVRNWTLVPTLKDSGTSADFVFERGLPSTLPAANNLVFQQQFAEIHAALGMLNKLAPFYDQTFYADRSSQFIGVASDVANAYESVFGVSATPGTDDYLLRHDIVSGNADPGAIEYSGIELQNTNDHVSLNLLRTMVDQLETVIYVRGGPDSANGWVTGADGVPLTFSEDTTLLASLLPKITNPLDSSIVIRQAGNWSDDSLGHSISPGAAIDPTIQFTELETMLHAMENGAGMYYPVVDDQPPVPVPDQQLWIFEGTGPSVEGKTTANNDQHKMDATGGSAQDPPTQQITDGQYQQRDVPYSTNPNPKSWHYHPPDGNLTGYLLEGQSVTFMAGDVTFTRDAGQSTDQGGNQLYDNAEMLLDNGAIWLHFWAAPNPEYNPGKLGGALSGPADGAAPEAAGAGNDVTVISWSEDQATSWLLGNDPGWLPGVTTPDTTVSGSAAHTRYEYNRQINDVNGQYLNDYGFAEVDAVVNATDYPSVYASVQLPSDPWNYTPPPYNPPTPGAGPQPGSKPLAPMPTVNGGPTAPFPLTTRMDYENTTPDTNVDGIVQVPVDLASLGNDTGVMAFQADRNDPQVYLPLFTDRTGALPIHGYIQEGAFSLTGVDGNPLTSDELASQYSDPNPQTGLVNQYLNQNGLPYAYSLDTYTRVNEILNDSVNHVKRIEVIRPGGNAAVFDFPWNPQTSSFSPIGTPLGYLLNGVGRDADRTYVLRDLTTNDVSESSESAGNLHKYALEFASGITQNFAAGASDKGTLSSVSNAQGLSQDVTSYLSTTTSYHFNQALANNTTDTLDSSRYKITFNLSNNANQPAYQGRIESIDYQTITPSGVSPQTIHTAITYNSDNQITALTKSDTTTSTAVKAFSYKLESNTEISRDGVQVTRTGTFTNGAAGTVTIETSFNNFDDSSDDEGDSSLVGTLTDAISFNTDGLVSIDSITLDEGYPGSPSPADLAATTTYAYHPRITDNPGNFATPGHYANGGASWGQVTLVTNPDRSWVAYKYDDGVTAPLDGSPGAQPTGWLIEQMTPFQSALPAWGESSNVVQYYDYTAAGYDGNLTTPDGQVPVIAFGGQAADPMNLVESPRQVQTQVEAIITSDVFNRYGATGTSAETTVVTRRAPDSGSGDKWSSAVFQTQNTIKFQQGTGSGPGNMLTSSSSGYAGNSTSTSSVDSSSNNINQTVTSAWGNDTLSSQSETINPFDNALSATDGTIDQPYVADNATSLPDAFGNYTSDSETGGVTTSATYPNTGTFWFGPQTVTEKDGSTTNYTYNAMGEVKTKTIYVGTSHSVEYLYTYDLAGDVISQKTQTATTQSGLPVVTNTYQYDAMGRLRQEIDNAGGLAGDPTSNRTTTYAWTTGGDFFSPTNILTITHPDTGTEIDAYYLDGSKASTGGTAVTPATYNEGVLSTESRGVVCDANSNRDSNAELDSTWTSVTAGGSNNTSTTYTNMLGEQYLSQENTPGTNRQTSPTTDAVTYFDNNGRPIKTVGYDGTTTLTVYDPVTGQAAASILDMNRNGVYDPGVDRKSIQSFSGAPTAAGQAVTSTSKALGGTSIQSSSQTSTLNASGSDVSESDNGAITDTKTTPPANGGWVTTITNPDLTQTVDTYADGLLIEEQHLGTDGKTDIVGPTIYFYNGLRELTGKTDYTGTTTYTYFQDGTQASVQTPGHTGPQSISAVDLANNTATASSRADGGKIQTPQNLFGQTTYQTGAGLLSAGFSYDDTTGSQTGQLSSLTTFQGATSLNANGALTGSGAATTSWAYDPNTGLLASKTYADGTQDKYQYNAASQLINAIEPGITRSSFGYDNAGEQTSASYTDAVTGTVSSSTTPDDMGRPAVISSTDNGVSTTEVNLFNVNNQPYQTIFGSSQAQVQYDYYPADAKTGNASPLALSTLTIQNLTGGTLASTTYGYSSPSDTVSRRLGVITLPGASPVTITYYYFGDTSPSSKPDASNQVQSVNVTSPGNPGMTLTYLRDTSIGGNEGRIIESESSANGGTFSAVAIDTGNGVFNQQDQIAGQRISQPAIGTQVAQTDTWNYTYNSNEADGLTNATDFNTHTASTSTYAYNYDYVGNRTGTSLGTANLVNEYSSITYNSRHDETNDGTFAYGWDALDRLISVTPDHPATASQQEQMGYDSQGRLLWRETYNWNISTGSWQYASTSNFVYDGSNLVAITDAVGNLLQSFIWGPTGLVAETDYPADPNNPNPLAGPTTDIVIEDLSSSVRELANARTGSIDAEYYYGPFGENYTAIGIYANVYPFGFQQMMRDPVSGKWYDKARWYDGNQGRFMSPDPSGEQSGIALFPLDGNDPVNKVDPTGLSSYTDAEWESAKQYVAATYYNRDSGSYVSGTYYIDASDSKALQNAYSTDLNFQKLVDQRLAGSSISLFESILPATAQQLGSTQIPPGYVQWNDGVAMPFVTKMAQSQNTLMGAIPAVGQGAGILAAADSIADVGIGAATIAWGLDNTQAGLTLRQPYLQRGVAALTSSEMAGAMVNNAIGIGLMSAAPVPVGETITSVRTDPESVGQLVPGIKYFAPGPSAASFYDPIFGDGVPPQSAEEVAGKAAALSDIANDTVYGFEKSSVAGRRGDSTTTAQLNQVRDEFLAANPDFEHIYGGTDRVTGRSLPEEYLVPLAPGEPGAGASYVDMTFRGPNGEMVRFQTVDTLADGSMDPRELANFNRIWEQTDGGLLIAVPKVK